MPVDREHILSEIKRTAEANGGKALGRGTFRDQTGIRESDWYGRYWKTWGEAVQEAGYIPNTLQVAFTDDELLSNLATLIKELGKFPVKADLMMKARSDSTFPSPNTFARFGGKASRAKRVREFCRREGLNEIAELCESVTTVGDDTTKEVSPRTHAVIGVVYLIKSGKFFKIGRTNSSGRRRYELKLQLPERAKLVHEIKTDDPRGIEEYWHKRFAAKRLNGEWFELSHDDVSAFRLRRFQ